MRIAIAIWLMSGVAMAQEVGPAEEHSESPSPRPPPDEGEGETPEEHAESPSPQPQPEPPPEPPPRTDLPGVLGTLTILSLLAAVASVGFLVERVEAVDVCDGFADDDPRTMGCLNAGTLRDQRDVAIGFLIGAGTLALGLAAGWIAAALLRTPQNAAACRPGGLGAVCVF